MRLFVNIVKRVTTIIGGMASWLASNKAGIAQSIVATLPRVEQNVGVSSSQSPTTLRIDHKPGLASSLLGVVGSAANAVQNVGVELSTVITDFKVTQIPAAEIVRVQYDLVRRVGGNASADVTGTWTSRANAEGIHNASSATSAGAIGAGSRKMRLDYANHVAKTELTITTVRLHVYAAVTGDATGLLSTTTLSYNVGAGETNLEAPIAGQFANLTTPRTYDITAAVGGDWSKLDALQTFVNHAWATAAATVSCAVDAIELEVIASATQIP